MSTKSSLSWGDNFHIYEEAFDDENIYIELENTTQIQLDCLESSKNKLTFSMNRKEFESIIKGYLKQNEKK